MTRSFPRLSSFLIFTLSLALIVFSGCQRELQDPGGNGNNPPPPGGGINDNIMVAASVRGTVVDENNRPVQGATVTSGASTTTTDRYGGFRFNNINLSKENGYVKVTKTGYFTGSRTFSSVAGRTHNVRIKLLPKANSGSFAGNAGGTVSITGGGKLVIPSNAVTDLSGGAYAGTVNVAMTWIDPTSPELADVIPGDLRGVTTNNEERGLETFGMLGVELTGGTGQALKIAGGKTAELTFPIPATLQASAPATIDLWNFDETTGRWKQEGTATKNGSNYIAQVSHFSFWNCDAPFPLVNVCMTILNSADNVPFNNAEVRMKRPNGTYGSGRTDSLGNLCGKVPKNEPLVLEIVGQCNNVLFTQNVGPFGADANLGTIIVTVPNTNTLTITGTLVNCTNANVTNGSVIVYTSNVNSYSVQVTNGLFSVTILRCDNASINFSVLGIDNATLQQGNPLSGSGTIGTVNVGTIQACGTSTAEFIEFLVDGTPFTYASPGDNISISDSSGMGGGGGGATIFATQPVPPNSGNYAFFRFNSDGTPGVKQLLQCRVPAGAWGPGEVIVTPTPTVNITTYGPPPAGFVIGSFNVQMMFGTTQRTVVCTFKVRNG